MAVVETSISINQPVEKVFEYLTDVARQKELNPMINEVVMEGKMAVASRYKIKMTVAGRAPYREAAPPPAAPPRSGSRKTDPA